MQSIVKSEFRKFLSIRSTYLVTLVTLALTAVLTFVVARQQNQFIDSPWFMHDTGIFLGIGIFATFAGILAILNVAHEYRYNTIMYTLTASNSRLKVFLAKTIVVTVYSLLAGILVGFVGYWSARWGLSSKHIEMVGQTLPVWPLIWQTTAFILANTYIAFLLAWLTRNLVASIVAFFFIPVIEQIFFLFMHDNARFLPFNLMNQFGVSSTVPMFEKIMTPIGAVGLYFLYMAILAAVTIFLYKKRDAN